MKIKALYEANSGRFDPEGSIITDKKSKPGGGTTIACCCCGSMPDGDVRQE